jgi:hypothetical protein
MNDQQTKKRKSLTAYAEHRGCAPSAVLAAIRSGRLAASAKKNGRVWEIDFDRANQEWDAHTDFTRLPADTLPADDDTELPSFHESKRRVEFFRAESAKLEYRRRQGELLDSEQAGREVFATVRVLRDQILNSGPRLADVARDARDRHSAIVAIKSELNAMLRECADSLEGAFPGDPQPD